MKKQKEGQTKKVTMMQKIGYLFDRKQKGQLAGLAVLILIGGVLETLGVSMMLPVVNVIMDPESIMDNVWVIRIMDILHIENSTQLIILILGAVIALFVIKNAYLLFQTYVQNTFVTRNRNRMISRVMREFLNRPYEEYLGADIPTQCLSADSGNDSDGNRNRGFGMPVYRAGGNQPGDVFIYRSDIPGNDTGNNESVEAQIK